MKRIELILIALSGLVLILNFLKIPGSDFSLGLIFSLISIFYLYFGFAFFNNVRLRKIFKKASYQGISSGRILGGIATGIFLSIGIIAIMFKVFSFPGAMIQLALGLLGLGIITLIALIKFGASKEEYYSKILKRTLIIGTLLLSFLVIPDKLVLDLKYPDHPELVNAILKAKADPGNDELWDRVAEERKRMIEE